MNITRLLLLPLLPALLLGQSVERFGNVQFQKPAGWNTQNNGQAVLLQPPGTPTGVYAVVVLPGVRDLQDPKLKEQLAGKLVDGNMQAVAQGAPQPFPAAGGQGYRHAWRISDNNGDTALLQLYVVNLKGGGAGAVVAIAQGAIPEAELTKVAASISAVGGAVGPNETHPLAKQWDTRLRGFKLMQINSSAGRVSGGGWESQKVLHLQASGKFTYNSSSSVIANVEGASGMSSGSDSDSGSWRIYVQNNLPYLEMTNAKGQTAALLLEDRQGATYVNGQRWLVDRR